MTPWLDDGDVRFYHGDALETVRQLPDESVDCVVTSPPYWGLRDYGTGKWDDGDPDCDHRIDPRPFQHGQGRQGNAYGTPPGGNASRTATYSDVCGKCGARRVDRQMGLEPTPDLFVQGMVELFREIRRVLAPHGTCWVNLGDSYASQGDRKHGGWNGDSTYTHGPQRIKGEAMGAPMDLQASGLKVKDMVGAPWRVAFALQADGWWLRSDIIWAKPNPMPESVTDRPTKAHEYVFLLTKQPRYWFDAEAVREPHAYDWTANAAAMHKQNKERRARVDEANGGILGAGGRDSQYANGPNPAGRNVRSVWQIATQPYPEAHFATYPEELARRCILAGCPERVCLVCGKPSERIVDTSYDAEGRTTNGPRSLEQRHETAGFSQRLVKSTSTVGWSDCECRTVHQTDVTRVVMANVDKWRPGVVLDPFIGSGTTAKVARDHQRHAIGIDLNREYLDLAARRLQQLSLLNDSAA